MTYEAPDEQKEAQKNDAADHSEEGNDLESKEEKCWMTYDEPDEQREAHEDNAANHSGEGDDLEPKEKEHWESHERIDGYRKTHKEDVLPQSVEGHDIEFEKEEHWESTHISATAYDERVTITSHNKRNRYKKMIISNIIFFSIIVGRGLAKGIEGPLIGNNLLKVNSHRQFSNTREEEEINQKQLERN